MTQILIGREYTLDVLTDGLLDESYDIKVIEIDSRARVHIKFVRTDMGHSTDERDVFDLWYNMSDVTENMEEGCWVIKPTFEPIQLEDELFTV